jgi:hypothetical protein
VLLQRAALNLLNLHFQNGAHEPRGRKAGGEYGGMWTRLEGGAPSPPATHQTAHPHLDPPPRCQEGGLAVGRSQGRKLVRGRCPRTLCRTVSHTGLSRASSPSHSKRSFDLYFQNGSYVPSGSQPWMEMGHGPEVGADLRIGPIAAHGLGPCAESADSDPRTLYRIVAAIWALWRGTLPIPAH